MRSREIHRTYQAFALGETAASGTIDAPIARLDGSLIQRTVDFASGERSVTHYRTLAHCSVFSHLELNLETGRTHQIRAHLASIGCPILGDSKYGNNAANRELKLKYQALCAWELTMPRFTQPDFAFLSGKTFHAPKPWYYQQVLDGTLK